MYLISNLKKDVPHRWEHPWGHGLVVIKETPPPPPPHPSPPVNTPHIPFSILFFQRGMGLGISWFKKLWPQNMAWRGSTE